jgi:DoxX-like family
MQISDTRGRSGILTLAFGLIWFINGLVCKVLNLVPRHEAIVARILGDAHARLFTVVIGVLETLMSVWIFSGRYTRINGALQILIIALMNTIEYFLAPDLLLWGHWNALWALILITLVYFNSFPAGKIEKQNV